MDRLKNNSHPLVIAGAGIGGLGVALALASHGFPTRLLEQAPEIKEVGAGIQLGPNSWRCLRELGVEPAVKRLAVFPQALMMMDAVTGEQVVSIPLGGFEERFKAPYALIHRADLLAALLDAATSSPLITLETSRQVKSFEDDGNSVRIMTAEGMSYDTPGFIAADGLWSTMRGQLIGDGKPRVAGHITYRSVLPAADVPDYLRRNDMVLWAGPKCHMVHYPLRGGELFNLVATFHSNRYEEGWNSYGDPAELHERFQGTCNEVQLMLRKITEWRMWVLCDREPIKQWSKGRVTLLGDAAHPMLQYLAQGAGMALEDSLCLAQCLDEADSVEAAFGAFPLLRYLRTGRVQLAARLYGEFYHADGVRRELRNAYVKNASYEALAWLYEDKG
ncbi:MAG TPA: 3-hydroxybenzoate 6-monooxygenase [Micropepsaceae bacterium]|jgi:salicylate hydroxylase|nr:3-hydroxybenzoate 6-monooxygenase [Micropepsaceae bacterium]